MSQRILIVGAGVGGLSLALALRGFQWDVEVVERSTRPVAAGIGIVLHPNGMRALDRLGLAGPVAEAGNTIHTMEIVRGTTNRRIRLADVWTGLDRPSIGILRTELHRLLREAVTANGPSRPTVEQGREVTSLSLYHERPRATFAGGEEREFDLVVGADGVWSSVRRALDPAARATSTGLFYLRFRAPDRVGLSDGIWRTVELPGASYGFIPLGGGELHCFVQLRRPTPAQLDQVSDAGFGDGFGAVDADLARAFAERRGAAHRGWAYLIRPAVWGRGRCLLLGDAAHAVAPTLSEGGSLAIEDAVVLSRLLISHGPIDIAAAYQERRRAVVDWALRMSLAQVNAAHRAAEPSWAIDEQQAATHLRQMYEVLRHDPLAAVDAG